MTEPDGQDDAQRLIEEGNNAFVGGRLEAASALYRRALSLFEQRSDAGRIADVLCNLGSIAWRRHDLSTAERYYEDARDRYAAIESYRAVALAEVLLGNVAFQRGDLHRSRWYYYRALAVLVDKGEPLEVGNCRVNLAAAMAALGDARRALRELAAAEVAYRSVLSGEALEIKLAEIDENAGLALKELGQPDQAYERLTGALATFERLGTTDRYADMQHNLAEVARQSGRPDEAKRRYLAAIEQFQEAGRIADIADSELGLGLLFMREGDLATARDRFASAARAYEENGEWLPVARARHNWGLTWAETPGEALTYVVPAWAAMQSILWGLPEVAARADWRNVSEQSGRKALELAAAARQPRLLAELIEALRSTAVRPTLGLPSGITSPTSAAADLPLVRPARVDCGWPSRLAPLLRDAGRIRTVGGANPDLTVGKVALVDLLLT